METRPPPKRRPPPSSYQQHQRLLTIKLIVGFAVLALAIGAAFYFYQSRFMRP